ncbi:Woronin body major protein [Aspergillus sp. HF37]|nr:Woronin body major protein [Aspergillus sp. HF37]
MSGVGLGVGVGIGSQLDVTEQDYRRRVSPSYDVDVNVSYDRQPQPATESIGGPSVQPVDVSYDRGTPYSSSQLNVEPAPRSDVRVLRTNSILDYHPSRSKMGYYDDEGHYHSFRRGVERAADRIVHPFQHHHDRDDVVVDERGPSRVRDGVREDVRIVEPRGSASPDTVPIPCHFVRIGDILILQGRPCQVIRISVSPQTGQYRYLGVDLFSRQLQEESSFVSNPSPSVIVQTMLGPVYKTYRILDLHDDATLVAMTELGDIKQGIPVVPQAGLFRRIRSAFDEGRGGVRALVINDGGRELVVDFKVIHGSRL